MKSIPLSILVAALTATAAAAEPVPLFTEDETFFFQSMAPSEPTEDAAFTVVDAEANLAGSGNGLAFINMTDAVAVRGTGVLEAPLTEIFRISLSAFNLEGGDNTAGARFRVNNNAAGLITSEARVPLTVTFRNDNRIQAKYANETGDGADTLSVGFTPGAPVSVDIVVNPHETDSAEYTLHGESYILFPESYDVFVGGIPMAAPDGGFPFHVLASGPGSEYVRGGINHMGWVGSTNETGAHWHFDDVFLYTGESVSDENGGPPPVPEPGTEGDLVFFDDFSDGNRFNLAEPDSEGFMDSGAWYSSAGSDDLFINAEAELQQNGSGRHVLGYFRPSDEPLILDVGDRVIVEFDVRFNHTGEALGSGDFRLGLFNSKGVRAVLEPTRGTSTGNAGPEFEEWDGIIFTTVAGEADGSMQFRKRTETQPILIATTAIYTSIGDSGSSPYALLPNTDYSGSFTIERIDENSMILQVRLAEDYVHTVLVDETDPAAFDTVVFHTTSGLGQSSMTLDNIAIRTTVDLSTGEDPPPDIETVDPEGPGVDHILFDGDFSFFTDTRPEFATTFAAVELIEPQDNPVGLGSGLYFLDNDEFVPVRAIGTLQEPVEDFFRLSLYAQALMISDNTRGARLRFGNTTAGLVTSESRTAFTVTFRNDNHVQAKFDVDGVSQTSDLALPVDEPARIDIVTNVGTEIALRYTYLGEEYILLPEHYHLFVDHEPMPGMPAHGYEFHFASGPEYEANRGEIDIIGWVSATADTNAEWVFNDVRLYRGNRIHYHPADDYYMGFTAQDEDWLQVDGFGWLAWTDAFPWSHHHRHGWLYAAGHGGRTWVFHDSALGWLLARSAHPRAFFHFESQTWILHDGTSATPNRRFYQFAADPEHSGWRDEDEL